MATVDGTSGDDLIDALFDDLDGESITPGNDLVIGDGGNDTIFGIGGDDVLFGDFGDDILIGGAGADAISGGVGSDTASYSTSSGGVDADLTTGTGGLADAEGDTFFFIENLIGSPHEDVLLGDSNSNSISGGFGFDFIEGGGGADFLDGGPSRDIVGYFASPTGVTVSLATGSGSGGDAQGDLLFDFEDLAGSEFADTLSGNGAANQIQGGGGNDILLGLIGADFLGGGDGNDTLDGGTGEDIMMGGPGDDTYLIDSVFDFVDESFVVGGGGIDTVVSTVSFNLTNTLGELEHLTLLGSADLNGTGNQLANLIVGNAGNNILNGLGGADEMRGFGGIDTYLVDNAGDVVDETGGSGIDVVQSSVNFSLADVAHVRGEVEDLVLIGAANLDGTGNTLANVITGNAGANLLDGGAGADAMRGLGGDDAYVVDSLDNVIEAAGGGTDTILAALSYVLGDEFENLTLIGTGAIGGTGNALVNLMTGNAGANTIDGGAGGDIMRGLGGNDTYLVDDPGDVVDESIAGSDGTDTVQSFLTFSLAAAVQGAVENLTLLATAITGAGNGLANVIIGNAGANTLIGDAGNDLLAGGKGKDKYFGGLGKDTFDFNASAESKLGAKRDWIKDFKHSQRDRVDLRDIDADTDRTPGNQKFKFIGAQAFNGIDGELRFAGGVLQGDTNGDGIANFEIKVSGLVNAVAGDFFL